MLAEDADLSDGTGRLIAAGWTGAATRSPPTPATRRKLYDSPGTTIQDFVYYDEANTGDATVDDDAVAEGIWKDGAAIDTLSSSTIGRAIALQVDGAAPHEADPAPDAEDSDWMQYTSPSAGRPVAGTTQRPSSPTASNPRISSAGRSPPPDLPRSLGRAAQPACPAAGNMEPRQGIPAVGDMFPPQANDGFDSGPPQGGHRCPRRTSRDRELRQKT